jgi:hypothetical protein
VVVLFSGLVGSLLTLRPAHAAPGLVRQRDPERTDVLTGS